MKTIQWTLSEISSGNWTYHPPSVKVNNRFKIKGKKLGQRSYPQKAHLQPLRGSFNQIATSFWRYDSLKLAVHRLCQVCRCLPALHWQDTIFSCFQQTKCIIILIFYSVLRRISDCSGWKMLSGDNNFYCILNTVSVINFKPCLYGVFNVYIYLYAVQLTPGAPLALQGAVHH